MAPSVCDVCDENFLNVDGECKEILAADCLEVESITSCSSCPTGFGFVEINGIRSC